MIRVITDLVVRIVKNYNLTMNTELLFSITLCYIIGTYSLTQRYTCKYPFPINNWLLYFCCCWYYIMLRNTLIFFFYNFIRISKLYKWSRNLHLLWSSIYIICGSAYDVYAKKKTPS